MKIWPIILILAGCAGTVRDCSSSWAENAGADWIVVQYRNDGWPMKCWKLVDTAVSNESQTDGIYWRSSAGHLVHLSGWYNRVQVKDHDFEGALKELGLEDTVRCSE